MSPLANARAPDDRALPNPVQSWLVVDERRWHVRVWPGRYAPAEPPVVLLHGLGASARYFQPLARQLRLLGECAVYAPDLPGFGQTERRPWERSVADLADAAGELWSAAGPARAIILGHSLGCEVAASLAVMYPELAAGVVLVGPTVDPYSGGVLEHACRLAVDVPREPIALVALVAGGFLRAGPRHMLGMARAMIDYPWRQVLPEVVAPTLVIRGERDPIVSQKWIEEMAGLLPDGRSVVLPGASHGAHFSAAAQMAETILAFRQACCQVQIG